MPHRNFITIQERDWIVLYSQPNNWKSGSELARETGISLSTIQRFRSLHNLKRVQPKISLIDFLKEKHPEILIEYEKMKLDIP